MSDAAFSGEVADVAYGLIAASQLPLSLISSEEKVKAISHLHQLIVKADQTLINLFTTDNALPGRLLHIILDALAIYKDQTNVVEDNHLLSQLIKEFLENYLSYLPGGREDQQSDVTLLMPLRRLAEKKLRLLPAALSASAEALLPLRYFSDDLSVLYRAYEAAVYIQTLKNAPIHVVLKDTVFTSGNNVKSQVVANDLLGRNLPIASIEVVQIKAIGREAILSQGQTIQGDEIDLSSHVLLPGRYHANLKVYIKDKTAPVSVQSYLVVTDKAQLVNVSVGVDKDAVPGLADLTSVEKEGSLNGIQGSAEEVDIIHVSYQVKAANKGKKPHQTFVRLTLVDNASDAAFKDFSVYFLSSRSGNDEEGTATWDYRTAINLAEDINKFDYRSGTYEISLIVGDVSYTEPVSFVVGHIDLKFPTKPVQSHPLYAKSLLHTSDTTLKALPEIEHAMRAPPRRAPAFMAYLFTLLIWLPLIAFVIFVLSLKPNLSRVSSLSSVAYILLLLAFAVLYAGYWFAWPGFDFYSTIKYLCVIFPVSIFVGRYALAAAMEARHKEHAKAAKKD
eukprot:scaffold5256_cov192-Ochromonas_danica.AAC.8